MDQRTLRAPVYVHTCVHTCPCPFVTCVRSSRWLYAVRRDRTRNALVRAAARPLFGLTVKRARNMSDVPMWDVRNRKVAGDSHSEVKPLKRPSSRARARTRTCTRSFAPFRSPFAPFRPLSLPSAPFRSRVIPGYSTIFGPSALSLSLSLSLSLFRNNKAAAANKSVRASAARNNLSRGDCTL